MYPPPSNPIVVTIRSTNVKNTVRNLLRVVLRHHSKIPEIQCVNLSNCASKPRINLSKIFFPVR
ncbi:hypothetical protein D3C87_2107550 [compost metagenome]